MHIPRSASIQPTSWPTSFHFRFAALEDSMKSQCASELLKYFTSTLLENYIRLLEWMALIKLWTSVLPGSQWDCRSDRSLNLYKFHTWISVVHRSKSSPKRHSHQRFYYKGVVEASINSVNSSFESRRRLSGAKSGPQQFSGPFSVGFPWKDSEMMALAVR